MVELRQLSSSGGRSTAAAAGAAAHPEVTQAAPAMTPPTYSLVAACQRSCRLSGGAAAILLLLSRLLRTQRLVLHAEPQRLALHVDAAGSVKASCTRRRLLLRLGLGLGLRLRTWSQNQGELVERGERVKFAGSCECKGRSCPMPVRRLGSGDTSSSAPLLPGALARSPSFPSTSCSTPIHATRLLLLPVYCSAVRAA